MIDFLVKRFVKNYDKTEDVKVRTEYGILASLVGIFCNLLLFMGKFLTGLALHSMAVTADAFNNLSDAASSIISFIGVKVAGKPADREHPFGHGRMEYISALVVAFLVIEVGFSFFKSSLGKIRNPEEILFRWSSLILLLVSMGIKLWMAVLNRRLGRRIDSKVMLATAADSLGDVATTGATVLSLLICHLTGVNVDGIAGLAVSILVIWSGIGIARDTLEPLLGQRTDPELYEKITRLVESREGILGSHDLMVHNYGPNRSMASIHAEVPANMDAEAAHEIIDQAEREAARRLGILLVIHMDPVELEDERVLAARTKLSRVLQVLEPRLSFHDFRALFGKDQVHLIFDLVVPYSYSEKEENRLVHQIMGLMQEIDPRYQCVITVDRG